MVATKGGGGSAIAGTGTGDTTTIQPTSSECCMCGDHGFPQELFRCIICKFRSQHTYCSNLYPKADTYKVCNWCLTEKQVSGGNSSNSSSSGKKNSGEGRRDHAGKNRRNLCVRMKGLEIKVTTNTAVIKKVRGSISPEESPASNARKRVGGGEEKNKHMVLRKSKSANHLGNGSGINTRPVFRNKVRRYKLLEEVSSQSELVIN